MRRSLLLVTSLILATGCSSKLPVWKYTEMVQTPQPLGNCSGTPLKEVPLLAGIKAYGLEGPIVWTPGSAIKVNWMAEVPAFGDMELELKRVSKDEAPYRLKRAPTPSLIGLPEPGCWTLTVTRGGKSESTNIYIEGARPLGFRTPSAETLFGTPEIVLASIEEAISHPLDSPKDRPSVELTIVWQSSATEAQTHSPLLYFPTNKGQPPLVAIGKSLVTGDCRDSGTHVAGQISNKLAAQIEKALDGVASAGPGGETNPWANQSSSCDPFAKS